MSAYTVANLTTSGITPKNQDPTTKPGRGTLFIRSVRLDFDAIATATGVALAADDTFQCFHIAIGETILMAGMNILTATTGAMDANLGFTGSTTDHFVDGYITNAITVAPTVTTCLDSPIYFNAADTLDLLCTTASGAGGVITVWALIARME